MFRVFGYVRVSTENQLENYSIDEQIERIKGYCTAKGWELLKIYTDGGFSGGNMDRPALSQMLLDITAGGVDAIVVYKLDRLSRSQKDTLTLIEDKFLPNGVDFISINENFDTSTPFGRAMIGILSVFAQLEKDQITERFTMGRIGRGKAGYYHGGPTPPTGYDYKDGLLVVNEYEAAIVREIFSLFLAGKSINSIVSHCRSRYPLKWSAAKVAHILRNSVYIGKVKYAGVEYDGIHEPIISVDDYEKALQLFSSAQRENSKTTSQKTPFRAGYLLSSLVFCARCGARYSANHGYYRCYSRAKSSKRFIVDPDCKNDNWEIGTLDNYILSQIRTLLDQEEALQAVISRSVPAEESSPVHKEKIQKRISEIDLQMGHIIDLYQIGSIPMEEIAKRAKALEAERKSLQSQLEHKPIPSVQRFLDSLDAFRQGFSGSDMDTKRMYVASIIEGIYIDGNTVSIKWRV